MTPTHKERLLADILAALLRIEALMQREKVAVTYPAPFTPWPTVPEADWPPQTVHPVCRKCIGKPCGNSACPSRPVITCGSPTVTASTAPGAYVTPTAALPGMPDPPIAPVRPQTTWGTSLSGRLNPLNITDHSAPAQVSKEDCAYPRRWMHGGWIHATGFSMVGP